MSIFMMGNDLEDLLSDKCKVQSGLENMFVLSFHKERSANICTDYI